MDNQKLNIMSDEIVGRMIRVRELSEEDGGGWLGEVPLMPGCTSDGETPDEARDNTALAMGDWLDSWERNR